MTDTTPAVRAVPVPKDAVERMLTLAEMVDSTSPMSVTLRAALAAAPVAPGGEGEIKVWVVYGDDHDYDAMSQWLVGVYETESEADEAAEADRRRYVSEGGDKDRPNYDISQASLTLAALRARSSPDLSGGGE